MGKRAFISYSHHQGEWVWDRLVVCLKAAGVEVLIDRERFNAGVGVYRQMDSVQDQAEVHVLVLSSEYLASAACCHEMDRAIALDPDFQHGIVIPVVRGPCTIPQAIRVPDPIGVNLIDDSDTANWNLLINGCGGTLGTGAPHWLEAREQVRDCMTRRKSVNLVVTGNPRWRELIEQVKSDLNGDLAVVDLNSGATHTRRVLVAEILRACGASGEGVPAGEDLAALQGRMERLPEKRIALLHFDRAEERNYGADFYSALRHLVMDERKLTILIESRQPFSAFLPQNQRTSWVDVATVELKGT